MRRAANHEQAFGHSRRRNLGTWLTRCFLWSFLLLLIAGIALFALALDKHPSHHTRGEISSARAQEAGNFVKRVSRQLVNIRSTTVISGSEAELNSALELANRTYSGLAGAVDINSTRARFSLSLRVHMAGEPYYLNAQADLMKSDKSLRWSQGQIGSIPLNDSIGNFLFRRVFEQVVGKDYGRKVLNGIQEVNIKDESVLLTFAPPQDFRDGFADVAQRLSAYSGQSLNFDRDRVQHYLDFLVSMTRALPDNAISLSRYLEALMREAREQTRKRKSSPEKENTAALYALAVQIAPGTFRHLVADLNVRRLNATPTPRLTLAGRQDLSLHFVYSAALKILSDQGISFSIGETKELIDANAGGSGFSFADIAADRAGIRFARVAIDNSVNARLLQEHCLTGLSESDFFPEHLTLPEGLAASEFERQFDNTESLKYQSALANIDSELERTLILGLTN